MDVEVGDLVLVEWVDCCGRDGWRDAEESRTRLVQDGELVICESLGHVHFASDHALTIAMSSGDNGAVDARLSIPVDSVRAIWLLS